MSAGLLYRRRSNIGVGSLRRRTEEQLNQTAKDEHVQDRKREKMPYRKRNPNASSESSLASKDMPQHWMACGPNTLVDSI